MSVGPGLRECKAGYEKKFVESFKQDGEGHCIKKGGGRTCACQAGCRKKSLYKTEREMGSLGLRESQISVVVRRERKFGVK